MVFLLNSILYLAISDPFVVSLIVLLIINAVFLFLVIYVLYRIRNLTKKKNNQQKNIPSIPASIKNNPERVAELNKTIEPFGFAYEVNQDIFYSIMYPWQREMGYCRLYDESSALLSMIIDCEPITFEYNDKRWLIEFWKGQYGMNTGGEVGIYYTTGFDLNIPGIFNGTFYHCVKDEDCINMYFVLRKNGNVILTRNGHHWWLTGFKLGEFSNPSELSMEIVLDLYDQEMANVFASALQKVGYEKDEYAVNGNRIIIQYKKPHSKQPITRNFFLDHLMQQNNEALCDSYKTLTSGYTNTLDKLEIIRKEAPELYAQSLNIGKPKAVFEAYDTIKNYLNNSEQERM